MKACDNAHGISARLRALRRSRRLTLDALSAMTAMNKSYLSRIERGLKSPSLASLLRISKALDVPVGELVGESTGSDAVRVVRRTERVPVADSANGDLYLEALSAAGDKLEAFVIYPQADFEIIRHGSVHDGEEILVVLSGSVEVRFVDRQVVLDAGDCVQFQGHLPHRVRRTGDHPASALIAVSRG